MSSALSRFVLAEAFEGERALNLVVATILPRPGLSSRERQSLASCIQLAVNSLTDPVHGEIEAEGLTDLQSGEHPRPVCMVARERARAILGSDPPDDPDVLQGYEIIAALPWGEFDDGSKVRGVRAFVSGGEPGVDEIVNAMQLNIPKHLVTDVLLEFLELVPTFRQCSWNDRP